MSWALSVYMYCRHKRFHILFDLLKYGVMSKYNVMCSSLDPMEELTATPPYPSWSRTWADVSATLSANQVKVSVHTAHKMHIHFSQDNGCVHLGLPLGVLW